MRTILCLHVLVKRERIQANNNEIFLHHLSIREVKFFIQYFYPHRFIFHWAFVIVVTAANAVTFIFILSLDLTLSFSSLLA